MGVVENGEKWENQLTILLKSVAIAQRNLSLVVFVYVNIIGIKLFRERNGLIKLEMKN